MKRSVLDFVAIHPNETQKQAIENSIATMKHAEKLGYHRYWFTEHHNSKKLVSTAPDLMIALALAHATRIRLGSGGIMLPNYASLKVAENFAILESMYPGKIDLGLGRAPGTNPQTALALARSRNVMVENNFDQQVQELMHFFKDDFSSSHPYASIKLSGEQNHVPNIMMLGSSHGGVEFAIRHDLPFVFAGHISPDLSVEVLNHYFNTSGNKGALALGILCADTNEEALRLARPYELMWVKLLQGQGGFERMSVEAAANYEYSPNDLIVAEGVRRKFLVGDRLTIERHLKQFEVSCNIDEIMMVDIYPDHESRLRGLDLLAPENVGA